ncbi:phospholipase A [Psychrobacter lutiphocae]|uniref:phospholipase A n=1 Tax=Psychrobacter lutiphocae TaxID=540500 RepID=UPI000371FE2A|nr:phospholipase A [Psychrobacter lutiphocae]
MTTFQPLSQGFQAFASKPNILTASLFAACIVPLLAMGSAQAANGMTAANTAATSGQYLAADSFYKCAELKLDAARLACYDKALSGEELTLGREKTPLDLAETFRATLSDRRPTVVFASEEERAQAEAEGYDTGAVSAEGNEILTRAGITVDDFAPYTALSLAYDLDKNSEKGTWTVRPYNPIYLMPAFAHFNPNRRPSTPTQPIPDAKDYEDQYDPLELKAQVSLKTKIAEDVFDTNADVWFGYTQQMHWQVYNSEDSRPFRATDYMPEVFITQPVKADLPFNGRLRMLGAGAIHHSNGQSDPLSRSWNRIYLMGGAEWGKLSVIPKVWYHLDDNGGDNPDITDYYGHGEIQALYDFGKGESLSATGRYNTATNRGAIQLDYIHPITRDLHAFFQIFHGYGESIIDYNENTTAVGVGLSLTDWKGL